MVDLLSHVTVTNEEQLRDEDSESDVRISQVMEEKKKLRADEEESVGGGVDRISDLPDGVLCKILSYLSTKNAVATNILSTRWKNLYPFEASPIYLAFDDSDFIVHPVQNESHCNASFVSFVDKLFSQTLSYNPPPPVEDMFLHCYKSHGDSKIESWLNAAIRLNVRRLYLQLRPREDSLSLFACLNGYTKLVHLSLRINAELHVPDNFTLPNLESLKLFGLCIDDTHCYPINKLLDGCPVLEGLSLIACCFCSVKDFSISSTVLRRLIIKDSEEYSDYRLSLDAPNLKLLHLSCVAAMEYSVSSFKSLLVAHIDIGPQKEEVYDVEDYENVYSDADDDAWFLDTGTVKLLTACSSTMGLDLSARAIDTLHNLPMRMPSFHNMTLLRLGSLGRCGWALLAFLLNNAPTLREVCFQEGHKGNEGSFEDFRCLVPTPPTCLKTHLRKIEFSDFCWSGEDMNLLVYFVVNGEALQMVRLFSDPLSKAVLDRLTLPNPNVKIVVESR